VLTATFAPIVLASSEVWTVAGILLGSGSILVHVLQHVDKRSERQQKQAAEQRTLDAQEKARRAEREAGEVDRLWELYRAQEKEIGALTADVRNLRDAFDQAKAVAWSWEQKARELYAENKVLRQERGMEPRPPLAPTPPLPSPVPPADALATAQKPQR